MRLVLILILSILLCAAVEQAKGEGEHHMGSEHHHHMEEPQGEEPLGICPVMGDEASKDYSYTYGGETYYFCCPMCVEEFKNAPQGYITKIKEIDLEAYQFGFSPEVIEVKKDDIVKISAISRDVPHGVYIKEYGINTPIQKDEMKKIEFVADRIGEFDILCSVYCGRGHNTMKAKLVVKE